MNRKLKRALLVAGFLTAGASADTVIDKPANLGPQWHPLDNTGSYVYADCFIAPATDSIVSMLGTWLRPQPTGTPHSVVRFEVWGTDVGTGGPDWTQVLASTDPFSTETPGLNLYVLPVTSDGGPLMPGNTYWFVATAVGMGEPDFGSYQVGGHLQNSVYQDDCTFWFSNDPTGQNFNGQNNTPEMAFQVHLTAPTAGCLTITTEEIICHAGGTTFTVNIEGLNACTGGSSMFTFTGSGGAAGEEICFTLLVDDGGFCCSTEICVTIPDCLSETLVCDFDGLPGGDIVTNQYPGATFSSSAGNDNKVHPAFNDTPPNILCTGPVGAPADCVAPTFIDFTNPVDSLAFYAIGVNDVGPVADVNVFIGNVFDSTVPVIGAGTPYDNILIDLSPFTNVTRIELTNITDLAGIGWDTFSFSATAFPSDLDGDGIVGMVDFLALLAAWGSCSDCGTCPADFDGDCAVGILDLLILLGNWG